MRGKLHVDLAPADFPGETPAGAALMVQKLPALLAARFPNEAKPRTGTLAPAWTGLGFACWRTGLEGQGSGGCLF